MLLLCLLQNLMHQTLHQYEHLQMALSEMAKAKKSFDHIDFLATFNQSSRQFKHLHFYTFLTDHAPIVKIFKI